MRKKTESLRGSRRRWREDRRVLRSGARPCAGLLLCILLLGSCSQLGAWDLIAKGIPKADSGDAGGAVPGSNTASSVDPVCKRRMRINLNGVCADASVAGFPLLVQLSAGSSVYTECSDAAKGYDICFKDRNLNALPFEIESWDSSGDSNIWVKVDFVADANTDYIYIYFKTDETKLSDRSAPTTVWSNGYLGVWHGKSGAPFYDSRGAHPGSAGSFASPTANSSGKIGSCLDFGGSTAGFAVPAASELNDLAALTIEAWIYDNGSAAGSAIVSKGPLSLSMAGSNQLSFTAVYGGNAYTATTTSVLSSGAWKHIALSWDGPIQACTLYTDGSSSPLAPSSTATAATDAAYALDIGNDPSGAKGISARLDELRISSLVRSAAWMSAQFKSEGGSSLSFGSAEDAP